MYLELGIPPPAHCSYPNRDLHDVVDSRVCISAHISDKCGCPLLPVCHRINISYQILILSTLLSFHLSLFSLSSASSIVAVSPLSPRLSRRGSAIGNLHMIVINGFDLFLPGSLLILPSPSLSLSPSTFIAVQRPTAKWPQHLH